MTYILENRKEFERLERQALQSHYSLNDELKYLDIKGGDRVLDAGCGSGLLSRHLINSNRSIEVNACDQSDIRVQQAKDASKGSGINFFQSSLESIALENESVDVVVCRFVYEYLVDPIAVTKEFHRVLKPGGTVYLIDLDGVFLNFWSANDKLNHYIETIRSQLEIDLFVGRKLPSFLHSLNFKNVEVQASLHNFSSPEEIEEEYKNNRDRIIFAKPSLIEILGGETAYQDFQKTYLTEMKAKGSTIFFNKFITWGKK